MQEGDYAAFQRFSEHWYPEIIKWVAARTTRDRVMDYAQGVWVHLTEDGCRRLLMWDGLTQEIGGNPDHFAGFLKTVTNNKVTELHRADRRPWLDYGDPEEVYRGRESDHDLLNTVEGEQIKGEFRDCFGELPRQDKRMLIMKWNGRADEVIGQFFRKTANNVRQRRYQMIRRLRDCLSRKLPGYFGHV